MALATASKGTSTIAEYYSKMKALADEMASAGRRLEDDEMVSYILAGLNDDYDSVTTSISNRVEPIVTSPMLRLLKFGSCHHQHCTTYLLSTP